MGPRLPETSHDVDEGQELVNIMREAAAAIDATDSIQIVLEIQEIMKKKESQWSKDLENARSEARNVAQTHQSARVASLRPPNVPSAEQHGVKIASLEEAQFKVSKAINDAEGALTSRQNERLRARGELSSWEAKDVDKEVANSLDTYAIKIRLAKQLGFEPIVDKSTGKTNKVIVRSDDYTNMDVVELEGLSEFEAANLLWERATTMDPATS